MSSWSITSTSIPKKHGEVVSSFRCACSLNFISILPFCGVVFDHQAAYADRVRYPSKLHTSHPKADVPRLKAGSTINPSGHSQTLLPMGHSSQTSVLCVVHMEKKPCLHYTCLFHPWFTPKVELDNPHLFQNSFQPEPFLNFSSNIGELSVHVLQLPGAPFNQITPNYICCWRDLRSVVFPEAGAFFPFRRFSDIQCK